MKKNLWITVASGIKVPMGIIMPYNDVASNIPSGWQQWTSAGTRTLQHSNSSVGSKGGNTWKEMTSSTNGSHNTPRNNFYSEQTSGPVGSYKRDYSAQGNHAHSYRVYYSPSTRRQVLMKATQEHSKFPSNTGILSDVALSGLTDITPTGYLLSGTSSNSSSNVSSSKSGSNCTTNGNHNHYGSYGVYLNNVTKNTRLFNTASVAHTHSISPSVTDKIRRYYMGMWTSASQEMNAEPGMYGIWESTTPPEGWAICDGSNGTPNLSGYHIGMDSGSKIGTFNGNGTITISASLATRSHAHGKSAANRNTFWNVPHSSSASHSHSNGSTSKSWKPLYYTVCFIKALE